MIRFAVTGGFGETDDRFFFDNVTITASGRNYNTTFTEGGAAVAIAGAAATVSDPDGSQFIGATVTLTNPQAGDVLAIGGALPGGIAGVVSGNTVTLSGTASAANYAAALKLITFSNTSNAPNTTTRTLSVQVTDATSETSLAATSYVRVVSVDSAAVAQPDSFSGPNFGSITGNVMADNGAGTDSDVDAVSPLSVSTTLVAGPTQGTVTLNSDGSFTYTPTGTGSYTDTFQYRLISLAQVPGTTYEYWSAPPAGNNLGTGFPTTAPNATRLPLGLRRRSGGAQLRQYRPQQLHRPVHERVRRHDRRDLHVLVRVGRRLAPLHRRQPSRQQRRGALLCGGRTAPSRSTAGRHTIRVDFFEVTGQEDLIVSYSGADTGSVKTNMSGAVGMLAPSYSTGTVTINVVAGAPRLANASTLDYTENQPAAVVNGAITVTDSNSTTLRERHRLDHRQLLGRAGRPRLRQRRRHGQHRRELQRRYRRADPHVRGRDRHARPVADSARAVTYFNSSDAPSTAARTVAFIVNDGASNSNTINSTVNVTAANDAPTLADTSLTLTVAEEGCGDSHRSGWLAITRSRATSPMWTVTR